MKWFTLVGVCAVLVFATNCRKQERTQPITGTGTTATENSQPKFPMLTEKVELFDYLQRTSTERRNANATVVTVAFEGMVMHVLGGGVTRAIIPRLDAEPPHAPVHPAHPRKIIMPGSVKTEFEAIFGANKCPSICEATIDGHAFRIVDRDGVPSASAFAPTFSFTDFIPHLSQVPSADKPFEKFLDLHDDVDEPGPVAGSVVAGFFELVGGVGDASAFKCGARFFGEPADSSFARRVQVFFDMPTGAKLQVLTAGQTDWANAATITLPISTTRIVIDNDLPDSNKSHFDRFIVFSKKTTSSGDPINLPDVVVDAATEEFCDFVGFGGRPGCSNSQFP